MGRPNKMQRLPDGRFRTSIRGKYHYLGRDRDVATLKFHRLMAEFCPERSALVGRPQTVSALIAQWLDLNPSAHNRNNIVPFIDFSTGILLTDIDVDFCCEDSPNTFR